MRVAFVVTSHELYASILNPKETAFALKKEGYDTCILIDSSLSSSILWFRMLKEQGINVIPGLKKETRYYIPTSSQGFLQLIALENELTDSPEDVVVIEGVPKNLDETSEIPVWESRYVDPRQKNLFKIYISLGEKNIPEADYHLLTEEEYKKIIQPNIGVLESALKEPFELPRFKHKIPVHTTIEELRALAIEGLKEAGITDKKYLERLDKELKIVQDKGFQDYFLLIAEIVKLAKSIGCWVGPGRGSAVGSLLVRALGITAVDPLKYDLYFERFLNPAREDFPDIDLDVEDEKRPELIHKITEHFSSEKVCLIQTMGTFSFRSAARALARKMKVSESEIRNLISWSRNGKFLPSSLSKDKRMTSIFKFANQLSGLYSTLSVHAAGIILSEEDLRTIIPLRKSDEIYISQWDMKSLEYLGFQKVDLLGLRNLSLLRKLCEGKEPWNKNPDNRKSFAILSRGYTTGIFQIEGNEATAIIKKISPENLEDLAIGIALNRPGPISSGITREYIRRRRFLKAIGNYTAGEHIASLEDTLGLLIFQEQVIRLAISELKLKPEEGELLRRALSKKDTETIEKLAEVVQERSPENSEKISKYLEFLRDFSGYSFNKSHSIAYSLLSYWIAYHKANNPVLFYKLLIPLMDSGSRLRAAAEARELGLKFSIFNPGNRNNIILVPGDFRPSLTKIDTSKPPKEENFFAYVRKNRNYLTAADLEFLIKTGFFDQYGSRIKLLKDINNALSGVDPDLKSVLKVFGYKEEEITEEMESLVEKAAMEFETFGFNLTEFEVELDEKNKDFVDGTLTSLVAGSCTGIAAFVAINASGKKFITDGRTLLPVKFRVPEKGFVVFKKGHFGEKSIFSEIHTVTRIINGPVPIDHLEKASEKNTLIIDTGKKIKLHGMKTRDFEVDEIVIGGES
ncbi:MULTISPECIES: DNA polymerase III subunit alpha [Kosmotoga]|uniref:DNA-directed DNA polymerase n=1 Tax=Kosmotoga olearia (strain ATCC BAA-1733 / DSM 21960 / TBF 19.5.1) TaxID=521045 RepID=C5CGU4_KOSOT|nr:MULTISPECIES: DNA polymerase III subunit alpha [Kosmotoga]ACR80613.1 DNA-directed DNA polymerase [Kosmotoga olearia TBF 19.5.1]MDI3523257.1 polymerase subunit alpha [Kosmotoga sp.]MDK2952814.1 polymerase subunit alpha [Kosmotoga sp.]OAA19479.1 hypothetical protein DU53_10540 [Kosmotoga sp. DU53]